MKKIKVVLMTAAVLTAAVSVFATRPCLMCELSVQYYNVGNGYYEAGELGVNYDCFTTAGICTFYKPNPLTRPNDYAPCRTGSFMDLD
jgi:hypothetical protein